MNFNIKFDPTPQIKKCETQMIDQFEKAAISNIIMFFNNNKKHCFNPGTQKIEEISEKGIGFQQIETLITEKFLSEKFQKEMSDFFDDNWKRIYEQCLTRALQHKANGVAFNKLHDLPPMK